MSQTVVRVEGTRELRTTLRRAGDDLADLKDANARVSQMVAAWASLRAPVGNIVRDPHSGSLAASVRGSRQAGRARITVGNGRVPYAGPIHWGWPARNITAQPFAINAAIETQDAWLPQYEREVNAIVAQIRGA